MKKNTNQYCLFNSTSVGIVFVASLIMSNASSADSYSAVQPAFKNISIFSDSTEAPQNNNVLFAQIDSSKPSEDTLTNPTLANDGETMAIESNNSDSTESANDEKPGLWQRFKRNVALTWDSDQKDFYLPVNTWHNRLVYDDEDVDRYNEFPLGAGFGYSRYDEDGDWHSLYALGFSDSNYEFEPFVGYGYEKKWGDRNGWHYGLGFTLAITAREEMGYIPIPIALPLASVGYKRVSLQTSYVPGSSSNGNVLFTWVRFQLTSNK